MKKYINLIPFTAILLIFFFGSYVRFSDKLENRIKINFETGNYTYENDLSFFVNDSSISIKNSDEADAVLLALIDIDTKYKFIQINSDSLKISNHFMDIKMNYTWQKEKLVFKKINIKTTHKDYCKN